jgi:HK97 family phage major capsid protein
MDIRELMRKHDELLGKRQAIYDKAVAEARGLTDEEKAEDQALEKQADELGSTIQALKKIEQQRSGLPPEGPGQQLEDPAKTGDRSWRSFGEYLLAIAAASAPGGRIDRRLVEAREDRYLNEGIPSEGGFLVQEDFINTLLTRTYELAVLASRAWKIPVSSNANGVVINAIQETSRANGSRWGGVLAYWLAEAMEKTESEPKFRAMDLKLKKLIGLCYSTDELLQDAAALEAVITRAFTEEFAFRVDDAIYRGTGAGMPLGILNSPCLVTVLKEVGQPAATILFENIVKMWSRMWGRSRPNAVWLINQDIEPQLFGMSLAVGAGGIPVYLPANGLSGSPYGTLMGRPVIPIEQAATLGAVGDIMLADLSQYVMIDKGGIQAASSVHVKFVYDKTAFRFVYRVDGQPLWNSPLTPFQGGAGNSQSPFVVLETRS